VISEQAALAEVPGEMALVGNESWVVDLAESRMAESWMPEGCMAGQAHNHLHDALSHRKPKDFFTQLCRTLTVSLRLRPMMTRGHSG